MKKIAKKLTAIMIIAAIALSSVGVFADSNLVFSDEYDANTQTASKAVKSDNVYEVTSTSTQLGDSSRLTRKVAGKEGWVIYEFSSQTSYVVLRAVNGTGDALEPVLYTSSDMNLWNEHQAAHIEELSGYTGFAGCEYTYVNFPENTKYVKLVIPDAKGDMEYSRQITCFKMYGGEVPDYIPKDAFYEKAHIFDSDEYGEGTKFLYGMGLVNAQILKDGNLDREIKRGEFADLLTKLILGDNAIVANYEQSRRYTDVDSLTPYCGSISFVTGNDLMREVSGTLFMPNENLTKQQLAFSLISLLGYRPYLENYGDAVKLASAEKLMSSTVTSSVTYEAAIESLYKALNSRYLQMDGNEYIKSTNSYLSSILNIEKREGQITKTISGCLFGDSDAEMGKVEVDGALYTINDIYINNYLGHRISFFYKINSDDEREIIFYEIQNNGQETIKVSADKISFDSSKFSTKCFVYENEHGKTESKTMNISYLLYNGERVFDIKKDIFNIKDGVVTLIDSDKKSGYDTILIEEYKDYFVNSVNKVDKRIVGKYGFELLEIGEKMYENVNVVTDDGEFTNFGSIKRGDIISVIASKNKEYLKIIISDNTVQGTVLSIDSDGVFEIGNEKFKLSETYKQYVDNKIVGAVEIENGMSGIFYLNFDEKVSAIDATETKRKYGYLIDAATEYVLGHSLVVKLSTEEGELAILNSNSKIAVENEDGVKKLNPRETLEYIMGRNNGVVKEELIKYSLNNEGKISYLGFSDAQGNFTLDFEGRAYVSGSGTLLNERYGIKGAKMFIIPEDRESEHLYTNSINLRSGREGSAERNKYEVKLYDVNDINVASAVVVIVPELDGINDDATIWNSRLSTVVSTKITIDEYTMEEIAKIKVLTGGALKEYKIKNTASIHYAPAGITNAKDLKKGDVVQFGLAMNGNVARINVWHRHDQTDHFIKGVSTKTKSTGFGTNLDESRRGIYGSIDKLSLPYIVVNDGSNEWLVDISSASVTICRNDEGEISSAGLSEVSVGDVAVVRTNGGVASDVIIYR